MTAWNDDGTGLRKNGEQWVRVSIHQATVRHTRLEPTDNHRMHYLPLASGSGHPRCLFDNQSVQASLCIRRITYGSTDTDVTVLAFQRSLSAHCLPYTFLHNRERPWYTGCEDYGRKYGPGICQTRGQESLRLISKRILSYEEQR